MPEPLAIYIHWPWCKAKCPYCDFNSHALAHVPSEMENAYVGALCAELKFWADLLAEKRPVASVFFGGGTPSLMRPEAVEKILSACSLVGPFLNDCEVTVECNPSSSSKTHFKALLDGGVNRLSIGVQSLRPEWLNFLGRKHSEQEALATLEDALSVCRNVNADIIYGLPDQDVKEWIKQLDDLARMGINHLSAYQLTVEKNTRFFKDVKEGMWTPIEGDAEALFFEETKACLTLHGYENYEISNFAKPGFPCRHNHHVWEYGDYLGIGAGAHGRVTLPDGTRVATANSALPDRYLRLMHDTGKAHVTWNAIDDATAIQEALFLGLRLRTGIDLSRLKKTYEPQAYKAALDESELLFFTQNGLLTISEGRLCLSERGWPVLNSVLHALLRPLA